MSKKRKLNSSNPKWNKDKKNEKKYKRVLIKKTKKKSFIVKVLRCAILYFFVYFPL